MATISIPYTDSAGQEQQATVTFTANIVPNTAPQSTVNIQPCGIVADSNAFGQISGDLTTFVTEQIGAAYSASGLTIGFTDNINAATALISNAQNACLTSEVDVSNPNNVASTLDPNGSGSATVDLNATGSSIKTDYNGQGQVVATAYYESDANINDLSGNSAPATIVGNNNVISQGNNTGSDVYLQGTGNHVTDDSGNDTTNLVGNGSQAQVDGNGIANMVGSNQQINAADPGLTVAAANGTTGDNVFGSGITVYFGSGENGLAKGDGNTVVGADGSGSNFSVLGQYLTVGGVGGNTLDVYGNGSTATVYGNGTVISVESNQTINEMSQGGTVVVADGVTGAVIYANHTTINEGQNDNVDIVGQDNFVAGNSTDTNTGDQEGYNVSSGGYDPGLSGGYSPPPDNPPPYQPPPGGDYGGYYGGYGGYDFAKGAATLSGTSGTLGMIASFDKTIGDAKAEKVATTSRAQAELAASMTGADGAATTAVVSGVAWHPTPAADGSRTITWSFAAGAAGASDPFSAFIGAQYQATIEQALQAWSNATGLTFQQVADSSSTNIRIGFGDFGTAATGILGYTDTQASAKTGTIQSAVIRLEDPLETALSSSGAGATYAGTGATLYQVALHEVGRALGFADNADPTSVMFATATSGNQTLDATDLTGARLLYGAAGVVAPLSSQPSASATPSAAQATPAATALAAPVGASAAPLGALADAGSPSTAAAAADPGVNQMIQAMATFTPQQASAALPPVAAQNNSLAAQLAAPLHH